VAGRNQSDLAASVGLIALFGVAMLHDVVLVSSINHMRGIGLSTYDAVIGGARRRLRPSLMTVCVASFGFSSMVFPLLRDLKCITFVIGGLVSSTLLTLLLLLVLYKWVFLKLP
jgi:cobalt-zinc-cadmium resistance protein CzcA